MSRTSRGTRSATSSASCTASRWRLRTSSCRPPLDGDRSLSLGRRSWRMRVIATDLQFPEGPIWLGDGSLLVVEIRRKTLTRVWLDGRKSIVANLGGGPNGAALGPDGACYVVNNGGFSFSQRADGRWVTAGTPADYV